MLRGFIEKLSEKSHSRRAHGRRSHPCRCVSCAKCERKIRNSKRVKQICEKLLLNFIRHTYTREGSEE